MVLKIVNFRDFQIETVVTDNRIHGFKVYSRLFDIKLGYKRNYSLLETFNYFSDAARFVAEQIYYDHEKRDTCTYFLTEFYSEGEDFGR